MSIISGSSRHACTVTDPFSVTMYRRETTLVLEARISGYSKEEVKVQFRDGRVELRGCPQCGRFMKSIQLPADANMGLVKTTFVSGTLTITIPQVKKKPKKQNPAIIDIVYGRRGCFFC